jgi:Spy/CpxP family protein refolding chaperone
MRTGTKILTAVAVMALLGAGAYAFTERGLGHAFLTEKLATLGVTDAQKAEVKAILRKHQPTAGPLLKQFVAERRALRDLVHAGTVDEKAIRKQAAKVTTVGADLAVERAHVAHEIRAVLTPEQTEKLQSMRDDVDERIDIFLSGIAKRIAED